MTKPDNSDASERDDDGTPDVKPDVSPDVSPDVTAEPVKPPAKKKERPIMPTAREAAAQTSGKPAPSVIKWGFYVLIAAVVVGVLGAIYLLLNKDTLVDNQLKLEGAEEITRAEAEGVVSNALWTLIVINVIFGAFQALFAYKAREGQRRARMLVMIATILVVIFHYLLVPTLFGQLAGLLAAIGVALLYLPASRGFYPSRQPIR